MTGTSSSIGGSNQAAQQPMLLEQHPPTQFGDFFWAPVGTRSANACTARVVTRCALTGATLNFCTLTGFCAIAVCGWTA
jgi:hypothetical protein